MRQSGHYLDEFVAIERQLTVHLANVFNGSIADSQPLERQARQLPGTRVRNGHQSDARADPVVAPHPGTPALQRPAATRLKARAAPHHARRACKRAGQPC